MPILIEQFRFRTGEGMDELALRAAIKDRLRSRRASRCLTQKDVGDAVGVNGVTVGRWENDDDTSLPAADHLHQLCTLYDCSADYLLGKVDHPSGLPVHRWIVDKRLVDIIERATSLEDLEGCRHPITGLFQWSAEVPTEPMIVDGVRMLGINSKIDRKLQQLDEQASPRGRKKKGQASAESNDTQE